MSERTATISKVGDKFRVCFYSGTQSMGNILCYNEIGAVWRQESWVNRGVLPQIDKGAPA